MDTETRYRVAKSNLVEPFRNLMHEPSWDDDVNNIYATFVVSEIDIVALRRAVKQYSFCRLVDQGKFRPLFGLCEQYNVKLIIRK